MDIEYPAFGSIVVGGVRFDHDVIIEGGAVRKRKKGPSRGAQPGHTPLTAAESLPFRHPTVYIGTGYSGRLPVVDDVYAEAKSRGVTLEVMPTAEACRRLVEVPGSDAYAVLHVTC